MITRIAFNPDFAQAMRVRALTMTELAHRTGLALGTVSAAVEGRPVNLTTAVRLARAVSAAPVVPELEVWGGAPRPAEHRAGSAADGSAARRPRRTSRRGSRTLGTSQLRIHLG